MDSRSAAQPLMRDFPQEKETPENNENLEKQLVIFEVKRVKSPLKE